VALTTLSEYKTYAGITTTATDTRLTTLVSAADAFVKRYCGRSFESGPYTQVYNGTGDESLQLTEYPVTSITSVTQKFTDGTTSVLDSDTYRFESVTGLLYRTFTGRGRYVRQDSTSWRNDTEPAQRFGNAYIWSKGYQNYTIVYVGGYATIPDDLKLLVWKIVDWWFAGSGEDSSKQSESIGAYSYTKSTDKIPPEIRVMLDMWKVVAA